jgi:predicted alpha/beta superfamily hydrolase
MGGLISLYSFFRASETFGFAGAMSPSLWFGGRALIDYVRTNGSPAGRLYVDAGTAEGGGTVKDAAELARVLEQKGYVPGESMLFAAVTGGRHEEAHWAERLVPALEFLLKGVPRGRKR